MAGTMNGMGPGSDPALLGLLGPATRGQPRRKMAIKLGVSQAYRPAWTAGQGCHVSNRAELWQRPSLKITDPEGERQKAQLAAP